MPEIVEKRNIEAKGTGRPDYTGKTSEQTRGRILSGWTTREGQNEKFVLMERIYTENPGESILTTNPLSSGETDKLVNAYTGSNTFTVEGGRDILLKQMWITTNQPVRQTINETNVINDTMCEDLRTSFEKPINTLSLGIVKSAFLDISDKMVCEIAVENYGNKPLIGKLRWVLLEKDGAYEFR